MKVLYARGADQRTIICSAHALSPNSAKVCRVCGMEADKLNGLRIVSTRGVNGVSFLEMASSTSGATTA